MNSPIRTDEHARRYLCGVGVLADLRLSGDHVVTERTCGRCGGAGGWAGWPGFTCYSCGGRRPRWIECTPIKRYAQNERRRRTAAARAERKHEAAREAAHERAAKAAAAFVEYREERPELEKAFAFLAPYEGVDWSEAPSTVPRPIRVLNDLRNKGRRFGSLSDAQADLVVKLASDMDRAKASKHVGTVGARSDLGALKVVRVRYSESEWGLKTIVAFEDSAGNAVVWFASGTVDLAPGDDLKYCRGTVRKHNSYSGQAQTVVSRVTWADLERGTT